jgi:hypothetical protein
MTFLEELQAHKGGLILLKMELYWYGGRGWDGCPGRICLLMDAPSDPARLPLVLDAVLENVDIADTATLLLIDGRPQWVWVSRADVELL